MRFELTPLHLHRSGFATVRRENDRRLPAPLQVHHAPDAQQCGSTMHSYPAPSEGKTSSSEARPGHGQTPAARAAHHGECVERSPGCAFQPISNACSG